METSWVLFLSIYQKHLALLVTRAFLISCHRMELSMRSLIGLLIICFLEFTQSVQFKGALSDANPIFSGVPQGSILGPLLFTIHFNDVHTPHQSTSIITYVDDTVFTAAKDLESIQRHLSDDCHNLSSWFRDNELVLNLKRAKLSV